MCVCVSYARNLFFIECEAKSTTTDDDDDDAEFVALIWCYRTHPPIDFVVDVIVDVAVVVSVSSEQAEKGSRSGSGGSTSSCFSMSSKYVYIIWSSNSLLSAAGSMRVRDMLWYTQAVTLANVLRKRSTAFAICLSDK